MEQENKVILLAGPTSSGKSKLALQLAKSLNSEIINLNKFIVLERHSIKQILEEQKFQYSGLIDVNTISDIGANPFTSQYCNNSGDLNNDESTDVLDVVQLVNCILFSHGCTICFDINEDEEYNVLDVLDLINIIINTD